MAEFLSQDEIDALLDIADAGEEIETAAEEQIVSKEKNYSIYDLKSQIEFQMNSLKPFQLYMTRC